MDLPINLVDVIHQVYEYQSPIIILDQLDTMRWTSRNYHESYCICREIINTIMRINENRTSAPIRLVLVTRSYDLEYSEYIKNITDNELFSRFEVQNLSDDEIHLVIGDEYNQLNKRTKQLLKRFLNLRIWLDIKLKSNNSSRNFQTQSQLLDTWISQIKKSIVEKLDIKDTDIKKVNNMMPSVLVLKLHNEKNNVTTNVAVGVKAKIQYVPQDEVIYRISSKNKDKNMLFNLIRSTTREISFLKDFVFALDKAKLDAIKIQKSSNTVWKILERRAVRNRVGTFRNDGSYGGIVSLVISADTLATLNKEYDFKATISEVENIISQYNLLAFFVADDVNERATYLFDDASRQFTTVSYTALEKTDSKDYKKIINLLVGQR